MNKETYIKNVINFPVVKNWIPGSMYAILYKDSVIKGVNGYKELIPTPIKNEETTLYDLASLTKVIVTNTILWRLMEKKKIHLEDSVKKYIDAFPYEDITIQNLATHTSGLLVNLDYKKNPTKEFLVEQILHPKRIILKENETSYSDINYILLGMILEKIMHMDLNTLAQTEVFMPLQMKNTTFYPEKNLCAATEVTKDRGVVKGVVHDEKASILGISGHAGLFSNVDDLLLFAKMILQNGKVKDTVYLTKESIDVWFQKKYYDVRLEVNRGFSWVADQHASCNSIYTSSNTICHTGFTGTSLLIDRDNQFAFIYLTNRVHPNRSTPKFSSIRRSITNLVCGTFLEKEEEKTLQKTK